MEHLTPAWYVSTSLKIVASILGIVGLGMGALHIFFATFGWEGISPSYLGMIVMFAVFAAEVFVLAALIMMRRRPHIAARLFIAASLLFLGSLVYFCVVFEHVLGFDLLVALFTSPRYVSILPAWIPLLFAGVLAWRVSGKWG